MFKDNNKKTRATGCCQWKILMQRMNLMGEINEVALILINNIHFKLFTTLLLIILRLKLEQNNIAILQLNAGDSVGDG